MKFKIIYSPFLEDIYSSFFEYLKTTQKTKFFSYNSSSLVLEDEVLNKYWDELDIFLTAHLQKVIDIIGQITTIKNSSDLITIYLTKYPIRTFSSPLVIYPRKNVLYNFSIIVHEILHTILNNGVDHEKLNQVLEKLFPNKSKNTQIHIVIYSLMIETFKKTSLLELNIMDQERHDAKHHSDKSYQEAFTIVDTQGSDIILSLIKKEYLN